MVLHWLGRIKAQVERKAKQRPGANKNRFAYIAFRQLEGITRLAVKGGAAPGIHRFFLLYRERVEEKFLPEGAVDFCPGFGPDLGFLIFILLAKKAKSSFIRQLEHRARSFRETAGGAAFFRRTCARSRRMGKDTLAEPGTGIGWQPMLPKGYMASGDSVTA